ncbi:hypothetical protein I5907_13425 [Panacibacter sp. DH6]|uniref:T9SS type A sorting domain-containing protein n=1 Tax=Panacibacter microcysteis TaxID=2793269 RepID=A0A931EB56_9BACT|nr:hypothetical protein [Panacibacter microcysteis]MBG9377236.1 hypothetical protein [Panacibacter microcysteis]
MKTRCVLLALFVVNFQTLYSQIWSNPITGSNPNTVNPYTAGDNVVANLSVSGIGRSAGIAGANANNRYNANNWGTGTSIDLTKYFSFTLTPSAGYEMGLNDLIINLQTSSTGPLSFSLRSSLDGYTTDIGTFTNAGGSTTNFSIDLTATLFQDLTAPVSFRLYGWNASGTTGGCSINDFEFNGYVVPVGTITLNTYYFRSKSSGNWSDAASWEASANNIIYSTSKRVPDENAAGVFIENGHTITINTAAKSSNLVINNGGVLNHQLNKTLTIYNGSNAYDFVVNGTYVLNGTQTLFNTGARGLVNSLVRADDNTTGQSDDFARNTNVDFAGGSVFQWNSTNIFTSGNAIYFPNAAAGTAAIFRVTKTTGNIGAAAATTFNGKFEVQGAGVSVNFTNAGTKTFRDGMGGNGTITRASSCGTFTITGNTAVIDGSITLNLNKGVSANDFTISSAASVTISGSPTINVGTAVATGAILNVAGILDHKGSVSIALNYGSLTVAGKIGGTGNFTCSSSNTDITIARTAAGTAGTLTLSPTANTIKNLTMNALGAGGNIALGGSMNINGTFNLMKGVVITGANLLTVNSGATITYPSSPYDSFVATCDAGGNPLTAAGLSATTNTTFAGNVGFRMMDVKGFAYTVFPVGPDLARPNRMAINPQNAAGTAITVVVGKGDILNTAQPKVSRIWYVHASNTATVMSSGVRLYFTKYDWNSFHFGSAQDEIEDGFIPSAVFVGRKDYTDLEHLTHRSFAKDIGVLNGAEDYAEYAVNAGSSVPAYYKFSAGNFETIVLPLQVSRIKASVENGTAVIEWLMTDETNVQKYVVERSANGHNFSGIAQLAANAVVAPAGTYATTDHFPLQGKNYYRIKIITRDGKISYSAVVVLDINTGSSRVVMLQNPVKNHLLNIRFSTIPAGKIHLSLNDLNGNPVFRHIIYQLPASGPESVVLPSALHGLYILRIGYENRFSSYKVLVE